MSEDINAPWSLDVFDHPNPKRISATVYDDDSEIVAKLSGAKSVELGEMIAATPELLKALNDLLAEIPWHRVSGIVIKRALDAIAKATGKEVEP